MITPYLIPLVEGYTVRSEIGSVAQGFKISRTYFLQLAFSDSTSPKQLCDLIGSVKLMAISPDFLYTFKKIFKLKHMGLWWAFSKGENTGQYTQKKLAVYYEIDTTDEEKMNILLNISIKILHFLTRIYSALQ